MCVLNTGSLERFLLQEVCPNIPQSHSSLWGPLHGPHHLTPCFWRICVWLCFFPGSSFLDPGDHVLTAHLCIYPTLTLNFAPKDWSVCILHVVGKKWQIGFVYIIRSNHLIMASWSTMVRMILRLSRLSYNQFYLSYTWERRLETHIPCLA